MGREKHFIPESRCYTGREFEYDIFREPLLNDREYQKKLTRILDQNTIETVKLICQNTNLPREAVRDALKQIRQHEIELRTLIKEYQKVDPNNPSGFLGDILVTVSDELDLPSEKWSSLKAYSALGTPLDVLGTDGFISWQDDETEHIVNLDTTKRSEKLSRGGSSKIIFGENIIFGEPPEKFILKGDKKIRNPDYENMVEDIAREIARRFKEPRPTGVWRADT